MKGSLSKKIGLTDVCSFKAQHFGSCACTAEAVSTPTLELCLHLFCLKSATQDKH